MRVLAVFLVLAALATTVLAAPEPPRAPPRGNEMGDANRAAAILLKALLERDRPGAAEALRRAPPERVVVVRGRYDHVETVLAEIGIPFRTVSSAGLPEGALDGTRLLVLNCPATLSRRGIGVVLRFVERGGHLLTTDWAVDRVLEPIFPGRVRWNRVKTRDDVVAIRVRKPQHPYLRGVVRPGRSPVWWIENASHPIDVLRRDVEVLVDSPELRRKYGEAAVLVVFPWGKGRVIHVVSHVELQRGELRDPWSRRPAGALAEEWGAGPGTPAGRRLKELGLDRKVRAGHLYSAYSIRRFLANVVLEALGPVPPPPPPPPPPTPIRPAGPRDRVRGDTVLYDGPGGRAILA
jgi:hypothetical protein